MNQITELVIAIFSYLDESKSFSYSQIIMFNTFNSYYNIYILRLDWKTNFATSHQKNYANEKLELYCWINGTSND
jgi:hypothetical protein